MARALMLSCLLFVVAAGGARGAEEPAKKNPDCPFLELNGISVIDDRTAILDMSTRVNAAPQNRRWFKVTFRSNCRRLKGSHFFTLESAGCPRRGDVVVFSRRPFADEDETDRCTIETAEEIPVQVTPQP